MRPLSGVASFAILLLYQLAASRVGHINCAICHPLAQHALPSR